MASWHVNAFRINGHLWVECGFPAQRANDADLSCFRCCGPEQVFQQTIALPVIWPTITFMWRHCNSWRCSLPQYRPHHPRGPFGGCGGARGARQVVSHLRHVGRDQRGTGTGHTQGNDNNIIIMDRMGICFTSVATSWWGEACCPSLCFPTGICILCCT